MLNFTGNQALLLVALLSLSGCGERYQASRDCHREAGPQPYADAQLFGILGATAMVGTPEHRAWRARVAACTKEKLGER